GNELACAVLSDLSKEFGKEYADTILKYADTDFTHIYGPLHRTFTGCSHSRPRKRGGFLVF
ncbi:MAG: hypothetical protein II499_04190, partial [Firmicutes bacterium]|nr:hypothetical protein [Bacillota bacterium]